MQQEVRFLFRSRRYDGRHLLFQTSKSRYGYTGLVAKATELLNSIYQNVYMKVIQRSYNRSYWDLLINKNINSYIQHYCSLTNPILFSTLIILFHEIKKYRSSIGVHILVTKSVKDVKISQEWRVQWPRAVLEVVQWRHDLEKSVGADQEVCLWRDLKSGWSDKYTGQWQERTRSTTMVKRPWQMSEVVGDSYSIHRT